MDPNATLAELLQIAARIEDEGEELNPDDCERMAELVEALDGWLNGGGFLPSRWQPAATSSTATVIRELLGRRS